LSYGHNEAGNVQWSSMQDALKLASLDGLLQYPVKQNRLSQDGTPYTGVVVQYQGDGIEDPHAIYRQLDAVKYQYGCFLETFLAWAATRPSQPWQEREFREDEEDRLRGVLLGIGASFLIGAISFGLHVLLLKAYSSAVFLGTPFTMAAAAGFFYNRRKSRDAF